VILESAGLDRWTGRRWPLALVLRGPARLCSVSVACEEGPLLHLGSYNTTRNGRSGRRRGRSIRHLLQFMPFLLCSAKPTEHLFICVMVSTAADPPPTMVNSVSGPKADDAFDWPTYSIQDISREACRAALASLVTRTHVGSCSWADSKHCEVRFG